MNVQKTQQNSNTNGGQQRFQSKGQNFDKNQRFQKNVNNNGQRPRNNTFCSHCKKEGHTIDVCFKIHGYPNDGFKRQRTSQGPWNQNKNYSANHIQGSGNNNSEMSSNSNKMEFTAEQYEKLMCLLNANHAESNSNVGFVASVGGLEHLQEDWNGKFT
ncbi:GATA zinc finger domain-containing protein 14-like [Tripterygium wilfordii]|uniref:GATA zinc finger domain-containing protein 14-like n=1 Tax=Tripterygium wilfordii TaxID=458696 RepID=UPI0018F85AE9|nr:GATA zinc finger domain-containing protein 14-like [Tripterygium wilfordii]